MCICNAIINVLFCISAIGYCDVTRTAPYVVVTKKQRGEFGGSELNGDGFGERIDETIVSDVVKNIVHRRISYIFYIDISVCCHSHAVVIAAPMRYIFSFIDFRFQTRQNFRVSRRLQNFTCQIGTVEPCQCFVVRPIQFVVCLANPIKRQDPRSDLHRTTITFITKVDSDRCRISYSI